MELIQIDGIKIESKHKDMSGLKKSGTFLIIIGSIFLVTILFAGRFLQSEFLLTSSLITFVTGSMIFIYAKSNESEAGIKNDHIFSGSLTGRGLLGWIAGVLITVFYVLLYWFPGLLENWIRLVDPWAYLISGQPADQWFMYGTFYTLAILVMGLRIIFFKYRHNRYHQIRTLSIMFFQFGFAFLIPYFLKSLNQPDFYFSYFWPLKYDYLFSGTVDYLLSHPGGLGIFMVFWGAVMTFIATPVLTYFFGKRWYCSWVCGCGGLANTLGDPWRQLSDKSLKAWKIERWSIHSVLLIIIITTLLLWLNAYTGNMILSGFTQQLKSAYGFVIGAMFSGVIGVGFYPILGTRIWCRFGCPLAAILGIIQKYFSKFRITTNGGQCISCGNCSTYCEMGIDVRAYSQKGQNIIRSSCVGCGVCAAVCPRGVLKLENGQPHNRFEKLEYIK